MKFTSISHFKIAGDANVGWESIRPEKSTSKSLDVVKTLPETGENYGEVFVYDVFAPDETYNISGEGMTLVDAQAIETLCLTRDATVTLTDDTPTVPINYVGIPETISYQRIEGSEKVSFQVRMRKVS